MADKTNVEAVFLGRPRNFRLTIEQAILLEEACDAGSEYLARLFQHGQHKIEHIQHVLTYALISVGEPEKKARLMVERAVRAGQIQIYSELCFDILKAFLGPLEAPAPEGDAEKKPPAPDPAALSD